MGKEENHQCAAPTCTRRVPHRLLMCRQCWFQVPERLRTAVYRAYRAEPGGDGRARQTVEYIDAVRAAVEFMRGLGVASTPPRITP